MNVENQPADSLLVEDDRKSSKVILDQLEESRLAFDVYMNVCKGIDDSYGLMSTIHADGWADQRYDLFWASMEILKPAIYTSAPAPIAAPKFKEKSRLLSTVSEMIERCLVSSFDMGNINDVMLGIRDDLAFTNRGVAWVTFEDEGRGKRICYEHLDRTDFRHEPARSWMEVGWVARRGWMTPKQMQERFDLDDADLFAIGTQQRRDDMQNGASDGSNKAGVWEVWSKTDNRVYWVVEGCEFILDDDEPHLKLDGFFPCPKPAYGTTRRRSLVPIPDMERYAGHLAQINDLTRRVYDLLEWIKVRGLIPGGGDVSEAVEAAYRQSSDNTMLIPVPGASLMQTGGKLVEWLPLDMFITTIQGLLAARDQMIQDFYQLSGISDIMRGATEANETLGAQQLKSQYGSIRVKDKVNELQRIAADMARIAAEIIAEHFDKQTIMDMSQMELLTNTQIRKSIKDIEQMAQKEMEDMPTPDSEEAAAAQMQKIEEIAAKYQPMLSEASDAVSIDQVMDLLRDSKTRPFVIEIETDSTVLTDEMAEKSSRAEFMQAFGSVSQTAAPLLQMGKAGADLFGGIVKFALGPYRAGRELDGLIENFIEQAPQNTAQPGQEDNQGLVEAQQMLAQAEMAKAQAQTAKVEADAQLKAAELQGKMQDMQAKAVDTERKSQIEIARLQSELEENRASTDKIRAETQLIMSKVGIDGAKLELDTAKAVADQESRRMDQDRAERQQAFSEQSGERQMTLAEQQAMQQGERPDGGR